MIRHVGRPLAVAGTLAMVCTLILASVPAAAAPPALPSSELTSPAETGLERGRVDLFWRTSSGLLAHRRHRAV
ncbi:MAG TPA: hypothetical protein VFZ70_02485 [Euzebyales bacterium]